MKKIYKYSIVWLTFSILLILVIMQFVQKSYFQYSNIEIFVNDKQSFSLEYNRIIKNLIQKKEASKDINRYELEKSLKKNPWVKYVEVYTPSFNTIKVKITQYQPLAIVNHRNKKYWLTPDGNYILDNNDKYPLIKTVIDNFQILTQKEGKILADMIFSLQKFDFLKLNIISLKNYANNIILKYQNKTNNIYIILDKYRSFFEQLIKLKIFHKVFWSKNINLYQSINLSFHPLVVCKMNSFQNKL